MGDIGPGLSAEVGVGIAPGRAAEISSPALMPEPSPQLPGSDTHSTPIPSNVGATAQVDELTKVLQDLNVPDTSTKDVAPSATTAKKNPLERLGPLKMVGLGGIAVLLMNLWKGIQALWKKPDGGGGLPMPA